MQWKKLFIRFALVFLLSIFISTGYGAAIGEFNLLAYGTSVPTLKVPPGTPLLEAAGGLLNRLV